MTHTLHTGDCREVMAGMDAESVHSIVCDPPYGLEFMGKAWDRCDDIGKTSHAGPRERDGSSVFGRQRVSYSGSSNRKCRKCKRWAWDYPDRKCTCDKPDFPNVKAHQARIMQEWHHEWAVEALRVAKPGAHLLAFGGTRTYHRLACAIEDAGWEIRDCVMWVYGSGFPKSHDVSKAIDKAAGEWRGRAGAVVSGNAAMSAPNYERTPKGDPITDAARQWHGWGTALKPAWEPIIVARKPLIGTVAANVQEHGCGAINVDGCRVGTDWSDRPEAWKRSGNRSDAYDASGQVFPPTVGGTGIRCHPSGRWPANLIHDGSDEVVGLMPDGAARYFYCAKASKADRDEGCEGLEACKTTFADGTGLRNNGDGSPRNQSTTSRNHHPTVKPTDLMRYLCRLVTPPGGIVLDPFTGSGSTGKAAVLEGFEFIGIEREPEYVSIATRRIEAAEQKAGIFAEAV